ARIARAGIEDARHPQPARPPRRSPRPERVMQRRPELPLLAEALAEAHAVVDGLDRRPSFRRRRSLLRRSRAPFGDYSGHSSLVGVSKGAAIRRRARPLSPCAGAAGTGGAPGFRM